MKKLLIIFLSLIASYDFSMAQNEVDALRYSYLIPVGTARFNSMGGAFGALGGDLTTMAYNPAGIGVYRKSDMSFTMGWSNAKVDAYYYGNNMNSSKYNFHMGSLGFVVASPSIESTDWKFINFGFGYNQLADFSEKKSISGQNPFSSFLDGETTYINNNPSEADGNLYVGADLIYPDNDGNYTNDYRNSGNVYNEWQEKIVESDGYAGEYDFSVGANYQDFLYLGATMGILHVDYEQRTTYSETPGDNVPDLEGWDSYDYFRTRGNGFNLKVGLIARVNDWVRLGGALHTPTMFNLRDEYWSEVNANIWYLDDNNQEYLGSNNARLDMGEFDWELTSPFKVLGSAAFIIKQYGLISVDYEWVDYSSMSLAAADYPFSDENSAIDLIHTPASNIRVGAEYRLGPVSLRGGFAYYGSPYAGTEANRDADYMVYSGGLGFKTDAFYVDLSYNYRTVEEKYFLYGTLDSQADLTKTRTNFMATLGFRF